MGRSIHTDYFFGNKVSSYGVKNGFVDYGTLAKAFDAVLANEIIPQTNGVLGFWELESGIEEDEEYGEYEVFQYYIISEYGANILANWTDEIVWYNETLNLYVWGVCHFGTAWEYVLTDIKIEKEG